MTNLFMRVGAVICETSRFLMILLTMDHPPNAILRFARIDLNLRTIRRGVDVRVGVIVPSRVIIPSGRVKPRECQKCQPVAKAIAPWRPVDFQRNTCNNGTPLFEESQFAGGGGAGVGVVDDPGVDVDASVGHVEQGAVVVTLAE